MLANQQPNGAFIASPDFGQYQYCWLRDASFVAHALDRVGELQASALYHNWVAKAIEGIAPAMDSAVQHHRAGLALEPADMSPARSASQASQSPTTGPTFRSTATASGCGHCKNTSSHRARVFSLTGWCRRSSTQPATSLLSPSLRASTSGRRTVCRSTLRRWLVSTGAFLPRPRCSAIARSPRAPKRYRALC